VGGATLAGFSAVIMWALLALLTDLTGEVPPFQLAGMAFTVGTVVGIGFLLRRGQKLNLRAIPLPAFALGVAGLFGYHFLYFTALRNAPAVDAGLIAYLWPLFIVLGSALLPGETLRWNHVAGAIAGLAGAALIVTGGKGLSFEARYGFGYAMAGLCAFTWSSYSLLSRRFARVPTSAVTVFCAAAAVLSFISHMALEQTHWPENAGQWLAVFGLGLMPVGAAFYVWDYGVKHGNIQVIGASSYAAPLLSTLVLVAAGSAVLTAQIGIACLLITGGAVLAAKDLIFKAGRKSVGQAG
jgi:drug/metabolite transporter (DMT)-like permease